jgi:hypothetical protein
MLSALYRDGLAISKTSYFVGITALGRGVAALLPYEQYKALLNDTTEAGQEVIAALRALSSSDTVDRSSFSDETWDALEGKRLAGHAQWHQTEMVISLYGQSVAALLPWEELTPRLVGQDLM